MTKNPESVKALAIAKLKNGESPEDIGDELEMSPAIIKEWADDLSPNELVALETNAIAIDKATKLLQAQADKNTTMLQHTLLHLALAITDEVKMGMHDNEIAKAINTSADTISKLQNSFFNKGTQIAVINNNGEQSTEELSIFRGALRS